MMGMVRAKGTALLRRKIEMNIPVITAEILSAILPFTILAAGGLLVALAGAWRSKQGALLAAIVIIAAFWKLFPSSGSGGGLTAWQGAVIGDRLSLILGVMILVSGLFTVAISRPVLRREGKNSAEYYALILFSLSGMILFVSTTNLLVLFIALELMSIPLYVLCGYNREDNRSGEAALKYFLLGSFSSAIVLYGIALLFGATGTLDVAAMKGGSPLLSTAGALLSLSGFLVKVGAVPFHMWAPDVYDGAPAPVTSFMATSVKIASFGALLRLFSLAGGGMGNPFEFILVGETASKILPWIAVMTMTLGNICALTQSNLKRMLAYSSIAHAGYLFLGLIPGSGTADTASVLYYLIAYLLMTTGAFTVVIALCSRDKGREVTGIERYAGVGFRQPLLGIAMTVFMVSLAGIPPTAGFFGKYMLFSGAVARGLTPLVVIAVLNSALSVYYYLRPVVVFYMRTTDRPVLVDGSIILKTAALAAVVLLLWFGFLPNTGSIPGVPALLVWVQSAAASLP